MSRYLVDKFLFRVDNSAQSFAAYRLDPAAFVLRWEETEGPLLHNQERTSAHAFTDVERQALVERDYETLYRMGAHPFLLWNLMAAQLAPDYPSFPAMLEAYIARIRPYGRPEFGT